MCIRDRSFVEGRIVELEGKLGSAQIIDPKTLNADGRCVFGSTVVLEDVNNGDVVTYQIVGDDEADVRHRKISISSPIARALIGKYSGDVAEVQAPGGVDVYKRQALNCALDLARHGVLEKYNVEMIGASREAIDKAEDREKFKQAMTKIGLASARSAIAHSMEEALQVQQVMGFPTVIRPSFTMGGSGGGIAYNREERCV